MKYEAILLFGAPGAGKGTQGKILGAIPGFFRCACGDVFRALDPASELGKTFAEYSKRGNLVPDDLTLKLWADHLDKEIAQGRFHPESDTLVLDGIPRNLHQAEMLAGSLNVHRLYHLDCPDRSVLVERIRNRALKENRFDDADETVIRNRLEVYDHETKPVLDFYPQEKIVHVDASQAPQKVILDILEDLATFRPSPPLADQIKLYARQIDMEKSARPPLPAPQPGHQETQTPEATR